MPVRSAARDLSAVLIRSWPGRFLIAGIALKLLVALVGAGNPVLVWADRAGSVALLLGVAVLAYRLFALTLRRMLWRVRRKLILSYLFIGVVPLLLVVVFFVLCGLLLIFNMSGYLVQTRLDALAEQTRVHARMTALEVQGARGESTQTVLLRRFAALRDQFPEASMAYVPVAGTPPCGVSGAGPATSVDNEAPRMVVGPWRHVAPPARLPRWVACEGLGGLFVYETAETGETHLLVRAIGLPAEPTPGFAVVVDLPVNDALVSQLRQATGIQVGALNLVASNGTAPQPLAGRAASSETSRQTTGTAPVGGGSARTAAVGLLEEGDELPATVAILGFREWDTGLEGQLTLDLGVSLRGVYAALFGMPGGTTAGLWTVVGLVAGLFLVIEGVALVMGLALARSITGSVHALFEGTERVRFGDFSHQIAVVARDQLGELANSFNEMTNSIREFLQEMEQKKRLEEELRIAREIQMSLLPQGPPQIPGLTVAALCVPAREVGGDYYDCLPLGEHRTGILIADVSGKGASAALYMAELKGLILALSHVHLTPRQLMLEANRIMAQTLDSRSFITMTYAVLDTERGTMTYARAGHTPLIHVSTEDSGRHARALAPDGMLMGLRIDGGERFAALLEEVTVPLIPGDVFLFFTDGISEAMNHESDCFGEGRLADVVEAHEHLGVEDLREHIRMEVARFVGTAEQHDDMTMVIVKVDPLAEVPRAVAWVAGGSL